MSSVVIRPSSDVSNLVWAIANAATVAAALSEVVLSPSVVAGGGGEISITGSQHGDCTLNMPDAISGYATATSIRVYVYYQCVEAVGAGSDIHLFVADAAGNQVIDDLPLFESSGIGTTSGWLDSGEQAATSFPVTMTLNGTTSVGSSLVIRAAYAVVSYFPKRGAFVLGRPFAQKVIRL